MYTLTQQGSRKYMVEGVDYVFGFRFIQATMRAGKYSMVQYNSLIENLAVMCI